MVPSTKNAVSRAELPALSIALAATVVVHLAVAAGVIWGGWLDAGPGMENPQPREMILNINLAERPIPIIAKHQQPTPQPPAANIQPISPAAPPSTPNKPDSGLRPAGFLQGDMTDFQAAAPTHPTSQPANSRPFTRGQKPETPTVKPAFSARPAPRATVEPAHSAGNLNRLPSAKPTPFQPHTFIPPTPKPESNKPEPNVEPVKPRPASPVQFRLTGQTDYDTRFIQAVMKSWMKFENRPQWSTPGKVVVNFKLHHDGSVSDLEIQPAAANQRQRYYCREALEGAAPFERWSKGLRNRIGENHRQCQFTFRYVSQ